MDFTDSILFYFSLFFPSVKHLASFLIISILIPAFFIFFDFLSTFIRVNVHYCFVFVISFIFSVWPLFTSNEICVKLSFSLRLMISNSKAKWMSLTTSFQCYALLPKARTLISVFTISNSFEASEKKIFYFEVAFGLIWIFEFLALNSKQTIQF